MSDDDIQPLAHVIAARRHMKLADFADERQSLGRLGEEIRKDLDQLSHELAKDKHGMTQEDIREAFGL